MGKSRGRAALVVAGVLGALAAGVGIGAGVYATLAPPTTTTVVQEVSADGQLENAAATPTGDLSVGSIYQRTHQGVVDITVSSTNPAPGSGQLRLRQPGSDQGSRAEGSGWEYDSKGDIVTNEHVVSGATSITVTLWNGSTYKAHLVRPTTRPTSPSSGSPRRRRCSRRSRSVTPTTCRSAIRSSRSVARSASPQTVTSGIVSALHRSIDSPNDFTISNSIQTDAPINHGNSGGPLLNASADVIGVNSQIQSESGGSDGVGFAIPVEHRPLGRRADRRREDDRARLLRRSGRGLALSARRRARPDRPRYRRGEGGAQGRRRRHEARREDDRRASPISPR